MIIAKAIYDNEIVHTSKENPKYTFSHFAFDWIKALVCSFFVQPKGYGKVDSLAECCMLCSVMALTKVIDRIAEKEK